MTSLSSVADRPVAPSRIDCQPMDPSTVLVLEAGRLDYRWDVFIMMPAALTFRSATASTTGSTNPNPSLRWMGAGSITRAARSWAVRASINGMIFQRGNPLDYERWAADPGWGPGTTRTACRTSSGWRPAWPAPTTTAAPTDP